MASKTTRSSRATAPAKIKGETTVGRSVLGDYDEIVVVEPITWEWVQIGSRCWQAQITGGRIRCHKSYYISYYDAATYGEPVESRSKPPSAGVAPVIRVEWRKDLRIGAGCAGHTIDGRFLAANERVTEAGRVETHA